jgi:hypothetical protein
MITASVMISILAIINASKKITASAMTTDSAKIMIATQTKIEAWDGVGDDPLILSEPEGQCEKRV